MVMLPSVESSLGIKRRSPVDPPGHNIVTTVNRDRDIRKRSCRLSSSSSSPSQTQTRSIQRPNNNKSRTQTFSSSSSLLSGAFGIEKYLYVGGCVLIFICLFEIKAMYGHIVVDHFHASSTPKRLRPSSTSQMLSSFRDKEDHNNNAKDDNVNNEMATKNHNSQYAAQDVSKLRKRPSSNNNDEHNNVAAADAIAAAGNGAYRGEGATADGIVRHAEENNGINHHKDDGRQQHDAAAAVVSSLLHPTKRKSDSGATIKERSTEQGENYTEEEAIPSKKQRRSIKGPIISEGDVGVSIGSVSSINQTRRNNATKTKEGTNTKVALLKQQQRRNYTEGETTQRILFLAGPHKTGSSTFQTIASHFTNIYPEKWAMSDPWSKPEQQFEFIKLGFAKHFSAIIFPLIGRQDHELFVHPPADPQSVVDLFRNDISQKWNSESRPNIVLGSEEMDQVLADHLDGDAILDKIFSILPLNTQNVTDIIVTYRSPKAKHLISLWKEVGVQLWNQSLEDFVFNPDSYLHIHCIEPLPLVERFLAKGMKVILVDIGGLKKYKIETVQLLGCDLMKEACDADGVPEFLKPSLIKYPQLGKALKERVNVRTEGNMDLQDDQIDKIETVMRQYDCGYRDSVIGHENLTILYDASFVANMDSCAPRSKKMTRRELWNSVKMAANPTRAAEEQKR